MNVKNSSISNLEKNWKELFKLVVDDEMIKHSMIVFA